MIFKSAAIFLFVAILCTPSSQYRVIPAAKKNIAVAPSVVKQAPSSNPVDSTQDSITINKNKNYFAFNEAPWVASIRIHGVHYCSGAIINENTIVTSGECVIDSLIMNSSTRMKKIGTIKVGSSNLYNNGSIYAIKSVRHFSHPTRNNEPMLYSASIRIKGNFNFDGPDAPKAIPLYSSRSIPADKQVNVTSWGYDFENNQGFANLTMKKWVTMSNELCKRHYSSIAGFFNQPFCAVNSDEGNVENPCAVGDLGDPLVLDGQLVGLRSWKMDCKLWPHSPTLFVKPTNLHSD